MRTRQVAGYGYLLLIALMFAASCEEPTSPVELIDKSDSLRQDSIRLDSLRQDSIRSADSLRIFDSIRVVDSVHVADSLHRLDSLAPLSRLLPARRTMTYGVYEVGNRDTTFTTIVPGRDAPDLYGVYSSLPDRGLIIGTASIMIWIAKFDGVGDYPIDHNYNFPFVSLKINKANYQTGAGMIRITKFDPVTHELSGEFSTTLRGTTEDDTLKRVFGAFTEIDLVEHERIQASSIVGGFGLSYSGFLKQPYDQNSDVFTIDIKAQSIRSGCRAAAADVSYGLKMTIPSPKPGIYTNGVATWSEWVTVSERDPRCSGSHDAFTSRPQDTLAITTWDPITRELSGWFTTPRGRATLKGVTWIRFD